MVTVMLIKSCKLVVVMVCGVVGFTKRYSLVNYCSALVLVGAPLVA